MFQDVTLKRSAQRDSKLEDACRRPRGPNAQGFYPCALLDALDERALLIALLDRRRRYEKGRNWLRNLRRDVDALAQSSREPGGRRRSPSRRAGRATPTAPRKRPRRREP